MAERLGRWDCNPNYKFNSLVTLANSQLICLWPVGILNLVGHNENYKLTSKLSIDLSEVRTKRRLGIHLLVPPWMNFQAIISKNYLDPQTSNTIISWVRSVGSLVSRFNVQIVFLSKVIYSVSVATCLPFRSLAAKHEIQILRDYFSLQLFYNGYRPM